MLHRPIEVNTDRSPYCGDHMHRLVVQDTPFISKPAFSRA